ncbi:hypothetical protein GRX03_01105 [Halovenus sp. WSH3]|uniref:Uncharacterized protein n=1 Tax=Halovenus carboxidivorans TaxID=2692199 RepID=A0A6B0TAK2_9EURY|nr:hypothetical protein [Halovenus carboxidivorans]MXR50209.1 hypothetical protein [Halovenus carboxidivorans]
MIRETAIHTNEPSQRKNNLTVKQPTYEFLRDTANSGNDMLTKGVIAYEVLLLIECERDGIDLIDDLEQEVNTRLSHCTSTAFVDSLEKIKFSSDSVSDDMDVFDSYYENLSQNESTISLHIPVKLDDSEVVDGWGFNRQLDRVVDSYTEIAYRDRKDRIQCKKELIAYIEDESEPNHRVAKDIVDGTNKRFDVLDIHHSIQKYIGNWWESEELTFEDIESRQQSDDERLTTHDRDKRIEALYHAYENQEYMTEDSMKEKISEVFDVDSEPTVNSYIADLKVEYDVGFEEDVDEVILPMDEVVIGDLPKIEQGDFTEKHIAYAIDEALSNIEDNDTFSLSNMAKLLGAAGWADNPREANNLLKELDEEYGIDSLQRTNKGRIYIN